MSVKKIDRACGRTGVGPIPFRRLLNICARRKTRVPEFIEVIPGRYGRTCAIGHDTIHGVLLTSPVSGANPIHKKSKRARWSSIHTHPSRAISALFRNTGMFGGLLTRMKGHDAASSGGEAAVAVEDECEVH